MEEIKFSVKVTGMDLFRFLLQHAYRGITLVLNTLITIGALVFFFAGLGTDPLPKSLALLFLALLFSVIYPAQLFLKAMKQAKNPVFRTSIDYRVSDEGIELSQGDEKQAFTWEDVFQIRETKSMLFVYTGRVYACIWPKRVLKSCEPQIRSLFEQKLTAPVYKGKKK